MQWLILLYLFQSQSHAYAREFFEHEPKRPPCNEGRVHACIAQHQERLAAAMAEIQALTQLRIPVDEGLARLNSTHASLAAEAKGARISGELMRAEQIFLERPREPELPLFVGGPSPGNLPSAPEDPFPSISFSQPLRERLSHRISVALEKATALQAAQLETASNIAKLELQRAEIDTRFSQQNSAAAQHGRMCQSGCRDEVCPGI